MKNENIRKINKLGKVSRILLMIMRVACIIGIVACIVSSVIVPLTLPKDNAFTASGTASAQITVDDSVKFFVKSDIVNIGGIKFSKMNELQKYEDKWGLFGTDVNVKIDETESSGKVVYDITADLDAKSPASMVMAICLVCAAGAVLCAVMLIVVIFAGKLAKALEVCNSPFEDNVIKSMRNFAFSLIPLAVVYLHEGGIDMTAVVVIIAVIIFSYIFRYGAELQKESDETV